ncbi:unnamed protein product, partial [marine sediment metagenome]
IVNMKSGFRFDEELEGFHLYGTYAAFSPFVAGSGLCCANITIDPKNDRFRIISNLRLSL